MCIFCVNISPLIQQQYSYIFRNKLQKLQRKRSNKFYNFNSKYTSYNICTKHIFISNMYVTLSQYLQLIAQPYSSFSLLFFFEFVQFSFSFFLFFFPFGHFFSNFSFLFFYFFLKYLSTGLSTHTLYKMYNNMCKLISINSQIV